MLLSLPVGERRKDRERDRDKEGKRQREDFSFLKFFI
jgi:hypothetical protein